MLRYSIFYFILFSALFFQAAFGLAQTEALGYVGVEEETAVIIFTLLKPGLYS